MRTFLTRAAIGCYVLAACVYGFHALDTNPQYDNQVTRYAQEAMVAVRNGTFGDYLLESRKYPTIYTAPFVALYEPIYAIQGVLDQRTVFIASRMLTTLFGIGIFLVLWRIAKRTGQEWEAVILLMLSTIFLLFLSAIRPHIPVTFWTLATLLASIRYHEAPSTRRQWIMFACAVAAFGTLQNGLFAFIFPVWALGERLFSLRGMMRIAVRTLPWLILGAVIAYPFVLRPLFGLSSEGGADLGHGVGLQFSLLMPLHWVPQLLGGEIILFALAGWSLWHMRKTGWGEAWHAPVVLYSVLMVAVFGFHSAAAGRFFLPLIPLAALLALPIVPSIPKTGWYALLALVILLSLKLTWLALRPNTYQQTSMFLATRPAYITTIGQPIYFFTVDPRKQLPDVKNLDMFSTVVVPDYDETQQAAITDWVECFHAQSSPSTNQIVLLWNDTPFALWNLLRAGSLGPNLRTYCARS